MEKKYLGLPSGYIQKNEKIEEGIKREIEEETKLKVTIEKLLTINSGFKLRIECSYIGYCEDTSNLVINKDEILEAKFFPLNDLPKGLLDEHSKLIELAVQSNKFLI